MKTKSLLKPASGQTYTVCRSGDGEAVGKVSLTPEQYALYESIAPDGMFLLGDRTAISAGLYALDPEWQDLGKYTTVYLCREK